MAVFLLVALLVLLVFGAVSSPWRWASPAEDDLAERALATAQAEVRELSAQRDAKYREIRDAELDHETGKLSDADFASVDGGLRAEAVEILRRYDEAHARLAQLNTEADERNARPDDDSGVGVEPEPDVE